MMRNFKLQALSGKSKLITRIASMIAGLLLPTIASAQCICGYGDGQFTLQTINIDGDIGDWSAVLADLDNNVCDGPAGGLLDRDSPVQSTGRDLAHFAYTWDQDNIYLFTERVGSVSNTQNFVYYADTNNDQVMQTGEPVVGVSWQGNNRNIDVYVFNYVSLDPNGDPMADALGFADGYTLPGSFGNVPKSNNPSRSGRWGATNGRQMEFFVTWAELGISAGSPFTFHVASSNASLGANSFTAQIDDNLSGCGGRLGSTQAFGVTFVADQTLSGVVGQTVYAAHTLTNTGNGPDSFNYSSASSGGYTPLLSYYHDVDNSGTLTAADVLFTDTDGDGSVNTATIDSGLSLSVLIAYRIPLGTAGGETSAVETTVTSRQRPLLSDAVTDNIESIAAPQLLVAKTVRTVSDPINLTTNPKAIPGADVLYTARITNMGAGTVDANTLVITDKTPVNSCIKVIDIAAPGSGPVLFADGVPSSNISYSFIALSDASDDLAFSNDNGNTYSYSPTPNSVGCDPNITHIRINPKGTFAAASGGNSPSVEFSYRSTIN